MSSLCLRLRNKQGLGVICQARASAQCAKAGQRVCTDQPLLALSTCIHFEDSFSAWDCLVFELQPHQVRVEAKNLETTKTQSPPDSLTAWFEGV